MTKSIPDLQLMSANLAGLLGGLQDIHNSDTDNGKAALLPLIQNCQQLAEELDQSLGEISRSNAKTAIPEASGQRELPRNQQDFDEIQRLNRSLSEIASLCASLDLVNWELCGKAFQDASQQRVRDAIVNLVQVICDKAEAALEPAREMAA